MNLADTSGRLARWLLCLAEIEFDVTYVKGIKICLADALSRMMSTGFTIFPIGEEILCFSVLEFHDNHREVESEEWDDKIQSGCCTLNPPASKPTITHDEVARAQHSDPFSKEIASNLEKGVGLAQIWFSRFSMNKEGLICRKTHLDRVGQIVIPTTLRERVLHLAYYPATLGHPRGMRFFYKRRQRCYCPTISVDAYATVRRSSDCAKAPIKFRKRNEKFKTFPSMGTLEFLAIDMLGLLPRTPRGCRYLLEICSRYSKLTRTVPLKIFSAETATQAFVSHWVFAYEAPVKLLSDIESQFTSRVFLAMCKILRVWSVFNTAYHPQTNGQVERFIRTPVSSLRDYLADSQSDWDQFTDALTHAYNCTMNRMIGMKPFDLLLS